MQRTRRERFWFVFFLVAGVLMLVSTVRNAAWHDWLGVGLGLFSGLGLIAAALVMNSTNPR
ncbi:MAG: hypothetical protein ACLQGN_00075 [Mycobacterium sp.]|jgi:drug/metabolite transporter (DMT)-like permease|uniref:hypothetical protein n=1 Tax=Mycobacterium sp. TaxID=1785 RepID=UPI003F9EA2C3